MKFEIETDNYEYDNILQYLKMLYSINIIAELSPRNQTKFNNYVTKED